MNNFQKLTGTIKQLINENKHFLLLILVAATFITLYFWYQAVNNSKVYFLSDSNGANWIYDSNPFDMNAKPHKQRIQLFKKNFVISHSVHNLDINIKAFKFFRLFIDEKSVYESNTNNNNWKEWHKINVEKLQEGEHELVAVVLNQDGPAALLVFSNTISLKSDNLWQSSNEGKEWSPVALANEFKTPVISKIFSPTYKTLASTGIWGLVIFFIVVVFSKQRLAERYHFNSNKLRWILLVLWAILSIDNIANTNNMGFDMIHHVEYVQFIINNGRLPLATDGLQMFQSPLFYIISAFLVKIFSIFTDIKSSFHFLKVIPLLCGIALVEVCFRCSRMAFPDRDDLQCFALFIGALMPVNLYMSQYFSNEPLLGILSATCILVIFSWIRAPEYTLQVKQQIFFGVMLGLALLAKATAFLLVTIALPCMVFIMAKHNCSRRDLVISLARVIGIILLVAGWYYLRNFLILGKPFVGGWDAGRGITWWQEPGFRNISSFLTFGKSLIYPVYAATHSFWDALYSTMWVDGLLGSQSSYESRPPWNYNYVLTCALLSLVPTIALVNSLLFPVRAKEFNQSTTYIIVISSISVIIYIAAIMYLYFHLPIYSTVKASYSLGILPCYAILIAAGLKYFIDSKTMKPVITSFIIWWGMSSYLGYFSLGNAS